MRWKSETKDQVIITTGDKKTKKKLEISLLECSPFLGIASASLCSLVFLPFFRPCQMKGGGAICR